DGDTEYEDWIYGEPPHDVDFVRFVGDEVARVETMKIGGEKVVRTEKEVDLHTEPAVAKQEEPEIRPANAPTLRRPGEAPDPTVHNRGAGGPSRRAPPRAPTVDPNGPPNWSAVGK